MTAEPIYDVAVVGSGFGGSICALRSAELGRSVVVLERGRRYRPEDFPRNVRDIDALFWRYSRRPAATGLYDVRFFSGLAAVVASGVGGGSLIYANIHVRPDPIVFEDARWPAGTDRATLDPYYDRVEATDRFGARTRLPPPAQAGRFPPSWSSTRPRGIRPRRGGHLAGSACRRRW